MSRLPKQDGFHCDWDSGPVSEQRVPRSGVRRFRGFTWEGITPQPYKNNPGDWRTVVRHELAGRHGERTAFHVRYFEIGPDGRSSYERHRHEHVVIVVRGRGQVRLEDEVHEVEPLDAVYVAPETAHQFLNPHREPFGFLCIVDAQRDPPQIIEEQKPTREG